MASASSEPSVADHLRVSADFLAFGARVLAGETAADSVTLGWAITSGYYAALHAVSAYFLARHGARATTHVERERLLRDPKHPEFSRQDREDYFGLKDASERARYLGQLVTPLHHALHRQRAERLVAKWSERARKAAP